MPMAVAMAEQPSSAASFDIENESQLEPSEHKRRLRDFFKVKGWGKTKEEPTPCADAPKQATPPQTPTKPGLARRLSRRGLVGIPRSQTFKRQEEEQRKNLQPVEPSIQERREHSKVRQRALSADPDPPRFKYREASLPPDFQHAYHSIDEHIDQSTFVDPNEAQIQQEQIPPPPPPLPHPPPQDPESQQDADPTYSELSYEDEDALDEELMEELKKKWILNLSMHFRDKSPREKFFLTYAETPDRWRRVTVSCDYRNAPKDSLEQDLQNLQYQKDKSARIYESIRMSLPDIQFYDTVTNLKLETKDDRLHVHVTEDINEIIPYPPIYLVDHLKHVHSYREKELHFDEHMSGFVYRVNVGKHTWIKKEIPGPDSVDEFLYEVNALSELIGSKNVIQLKGLVIDNDGKLIKGLLLGYAEQGALVDIIYDSKENHIPRVPWARRERWAKQIIQGLSNLHEAGFVQGDFTLSNIVIDEKDEAQIIDINRRGCPVGWESPEMVPLVESGQRLSMYIGVKSDLYQLGMVLWALAMEKDEPERAHRPLSLGDAGNEIPQYYKHLTGICLSEKPKDRFAAKDLLAMFSAPALFSDLRRQDMSPMSATESHGSPDPEQRENVQSEEIEQMGMTFQERQTRYQRTNGAHLASVAEHERSRREEVDEEGFRGRRYSPVRPGTLDVPLDGSPTLVNSRNGVHPPRKQLSFANRSTEFPAEYNTEDAQIISISPTGDGGWQEITRDGNPYLIHRDTLESLDELQQTEHARRKKGVEQWRHDIIEHVDSGLADMGPDSAIEPHSPLELVGIGGHETLTSGDGPPPQRITDDLDIDPKPEIDLPQHLTNEPSIEHTLEEDASQHLTAKTEVGAEDQKDITQGITEDLGVEQHIKEKDEPQGTTAPGDQYLGEDIKTDP